MGFANSFLIGKLQGGRGIPQATKLHQLGIEPSKDSRMTKAPKDQTALITGGGSGIGRAFARALCEAGFGTVLIASRRKDVISQTCSELQAEFPGQRLLAYPFDIRDRQQTESLMRYATDVVGGVDVLINNSGLAIPETVESISDQGWDTVLDTNLRGAMWLTQLVLPGMVAQNFGDIVNVSSQAGKHGYADVPSYCASKFGLLGFAESVRDDVCKRGLDIRVFNLCPALVDIECDNESKPRPGFLHVRAMAQTLRYALALDRNVVLQDINISGR